MTRLRSAILAATLGAALTAGHGSQAQELNLIQVCLQQPAQCVALMEAQITALQAAGLTSAELDQEIGVIVAQLYSAAQSAETPAPLPEIGKAISTASSYISNPDVADSFVEVANVVTSGEAATTELQAFGLSPEPTLPPTTGVPASGN